MAEEKEKKQLDFLTEVRKDLEFGVENITGESDLEDQRDVTMFKKDFQLTKTEYLNDIKLKQEESTSGAPTYTPKNFFEQLYLQNDSGTYYLWVYVNNTWRKIEILAA